MHSIILLSIIAMIFKDIQQDSKPQSIPSTYTAAQKGISYALQGNWDMAHRSVQTALTPDASWVHAHLHREEGDIPNAKFWYNIAGKSFPTTDIETERKEIADALLGC